MTEKTKGFNHGKKRGRMLLWAAAVLIALSACAAPNGGGSEPPAASQSAVPDAVSEVAEKWAEAVKNRDGRAQYELMTPALQKRVYDEFSGLNWVTGTSSPWVERYSVEETDAGARVTMDYASSAGDEGAYVQDLSFAEADGALKISAISDPVRAEGSGVMNLSDLTGLLGMTQEELLAAMGDETPEGVDEGGLGFVTSGIRVWFDDATHTKVAQVFVMTDAVDLNGLRRGDSLADFVKVFGQPLSDENGDARFAWGDVFLSVIYDASSETDEVAGVYVLQENF